MIAIGTFTRSSSFRVGALFTLLCIGTMGFILYFWSLASNQTFLREAQAALGAERYAMQAIYETGGETALVARVTERASTAETRNLYGLVRSHRLIAGNLKTLPELVFSPSADSALLELDWAAMTTGAEKSFEGLQQVLVTRVELQNGDELILGRNVDDLHYAQRIGQTFSWAVVSLLLLISVVSFWVARYVVQRINRMAHTADNIMQTGDLSQRLEIDSNWDDLSKLAIVFNRMLATIESSVQSIKTVSDNIAHDLRTPLTRLRNTLSRFPAGEQREQALSEADNLLAMFNGLLRIGQLESEQQRQGFTAIDLDSLIQDVIALYAPLAEEQQLSLTAELQPVPYFADPDLMFQAVANLLDNSLKYAPAGSQIIVTLSLRQDIICIRVEDTGPGMNPNDFHQLTRRFYRADASRSTPGNGLGLSMVEAVVRLHHGRLWFVDNPLLTASGFGATITLPRRSVNAPDCPR
ncbi:HAMP domain-containing protein [Alteromonas aestuariivivens]|uniref:histidine kinase n=1 Tax=Alteromonas aestuariivivens TaxID=1938339 RepID=A0A3D8MFM3_9ALTE|nr:ATP-binding protein [Alteromonas aestuariivivens]RDV29008.1 HAMP domain-containing protein [Alteromonas aestuariivivens]